MKMSIRAIFDYEKISYDEVWSMLKRVLEDFYPNCLCDWKNYQKKIKFDGIEKMFMKGFGNVANDHFEVVIGRDGGYRFSFLMMYVFEHNVEFSDAIFRLFSCRFEFVYGFTLDFQFQRLQVSSSVHPFMAAGKPHDHLPRLTASEWNKPLLEQKLDTSGNPGRFRFHQGYIEALGGVMYLTDKLFSLSGGQRQNLFELEFVSITDWGDCIRVELDSNLLVDADRNIELCENMELLRSVIFDNNVVGNG